MFRFLSDRHDPFALDAGDTPPIANAIQFIIQSVRPIRGIIALCTFATISAALIEVWLIYYVGHLIDSLVGIDRSDLWAVLGPDLIFAACVLLILRPLVSFAYEALSSMADWMLDAVAAPYGSLGATCEAMRTIGQPIDLPEPEEAKPLARAGGAITFANIHHHYGQNAGGLDGVSFTVAPGEKLGLVGPSGAGKSTLVKLLMRHAAPERGRICIDDQDIAQVQQVSLRRNIAAVAQDAALLHRSIRENITMGQDVPDAAVTAAAQHAQAHDFITELRDQDGHSGYNTVVGERGVRLSGGQRQRVSLARALLRNAPILILDEATSALDSTVEVDILQALYSFMEDKTVIAITHRLSTIAHMDRIAVMDRGRIVALDTHAALLSQRGLYAELWAKQSGGLIGAQ